MEVAIAYFTIGLFSGIFGLVFMVKLYKPAIGSAKDYSLINKFTFIVTTMIFWLPIVIGYNMAKATGEDFIDDRAYHGDDSAYKKYHELLMEIRGLRMELKG